MLLASSLYFFNPFQQLFFISVEYPTVWRLSDKSTSGQKHEKIKCIKPLNRKRRKLNITHGNCRTVCLQRDAPAKLLFSSPIYKQFSESIEPKISAFYNPPSCPITWYIFFIFPLYSYNMVSVTVFFNQFSEIRTIIENWT